MNFEPFCIITISLVSADCDTVDPSLNIAVDNSQLPAQHGTDLMYSCPRSGDIKDGNVKAVCTDGNISLSPETPLPCRDIGTRDTRKYKLKIKCRAQ